MTLTKSAKTPVRNITVTEAQPEAQTFLDAMCRELQQVHAALASTSPKMGQLGSWILGSWISQGI